VLYPLIDPIYDSSGNIPAGVFENIKPYEIDTTTLTLTSITQILYFENGLLKSYIPWVSPSIIKAVTETNILLGYSDYFSSCYNYNFNYQPKEKNEILYLGETRQKLCYDSVGNDYHPIKELYGRNLIKTLLLNFWTSKLDIYPSDSELKLKKEDINDYYDSLGNLVKSKYLEKYSSLEDFKEIQLVQDWYYNYTENIVFNKIKALYLCAKKNTAKGEDKEASPILKIVFR